MRMMRSMIVRRLVTGISIILLLLCQTAAAALACATTPLLPPVQSAALNAAAPCHHEAQEAIGVDANQPEHGCLVRCPSRYSSIETTKVDVTATDNLPLGVFFKVPSPALAALTTPYVQIAACAAAPPLTLVYCRLLI